MKPSVAALPQILPLLLLTLSFGCGEPTEQAPVGHAEKVEAPGEPSPPVARYGTIVVRDMGEIQIEFLPELAPGTVENFQKLSQENFYNGTTFHRVIPGFMIQAGDSKSKNDDPSDDGTGGPGYTIDAEFSDEPHVRGILSMARGSDPNSAGSQFFIVTHDSNHLDRQYTVFARVLSGMEVVDRIVHTPRGVRDRPLKEVVIETIRIEDQLPGASE